MSCSPREWLELALHLAELPGEVAQRSAISRAYYAALHAARLTFPEIPNYPRRQNESSHTFVIRRVAEYAADKAHANRREAGLIAMRLDSSRRERNEADYSIRGVVKPYAVGETMKKATLILELCAQIERARATTLSSN